ncbi:hypothetical protein PATSB16_20800 [Pandoraea thiooxydans]|nr:hypothetical protein PATSB16_20800 [Pandoraea thiooxydans]
MPSRTKTLWALSYRRAAFDQKQRGPHRCRMAAAVTMAGLEAGCTVSRNHLIDCLTGSGPLYHDGQWFSHAPHFHRLR